MNVFELFAKIGLDTSEYDSGLSKAGRALSGFGSKLGGALAGLAKLTTTAMVGVTTAAGGATIKLTKDAVAAYGEYEQLVGGVKKLFGNSWNKVIDSAEKAFSTAGMSANEYMQTVTSFSASLISGLEGDTQKAANLADVAIRDMSDNANTFGTDIRSIQAAYQGFAKQNYTMLDNLKLGFGGTAGEMARLINESGVLGDSIEVTAKTVNSVSFDKMIEAIHIMQERMSISGTTAKEAADTITGSLSSVKAAWTNLITVMGGGEGDISSSVKKLTDTVAAFGKNMLPTIMTAMEGVVSLVDKLAPEIVKALPELAEKIIPQVGRTITSLTPIVITSVADIIKTLARQIPKMVPALLDAWKKVYTALIDSLDVLLDELIPMLPQIIDTIAEFLTENAPKLVEAGLRLLIAILEGIEQNIDQIVDTIAKIIPVIINTITENLPKILEVGGKIIAKLAAGVAEHLPEIAMAVVKMFATMYLEIFKHLPDIVQAGGDIIASLAMGIVNAFSKIHDALSDLFLKIAGWFDEKIEFMKGYGKYLIEWIGDGVGGAVETVKNKFKEIWQAIKDFFSGVWQEAVRIGENIIAGIVEGFTKGFSTLKGAVTDDFWGNWKSGMKSILGIHSPSRVMRDEIGVPLAEGIGVGFEQEMQNVNRMMQNGIDTDFSIRPALTTENPRSTDRSDPSQQQNHTITMRLVDGWNRIIAEGTASDIDILQNDLVVLGTRGLAT